MSDSVDKQIENQADKLHEWKVRLRESLTQRELIEILVANEQFVPADDDDSDAVCVFDVLILIKLIRIISCRF